MTGSPGDLLHQSDKKLDKGTARFLRPAYVLLALTAIAVTWKVSAGSLLTTSAVIVLFSLVVALLVAGLARTKNLAGSTLIWLLLALSAVVACLFISSVFFGTPERGRIFAARILEARNLAILDVHAPSLIVGPGITTLPRDARIPPEISGDEYEKIAMLSRRPPVTLKGAEVHVDAPIFYFNVLRLEDAEIITDGRDVTIEANRIEALGNVSIKAAIPAAAAGQLGKPGGKVTLIVHHQLLGQMEVDLKGGDGGPGIAGPSGAKGANGGPGNNSSQTAFGCSHGGGTGGAGQTGGNGGPGGPGLHGGDGGTLVLQSPRPDDFGALITFTAVGGAGGVGGSGGDGGPGGNGGPGGHGGGYCGGGQAGPAGGSGKPGPAGDSGTRGNEGIFRKIAP